MDTAHRASHAFEVAPHPASRLWSLVAALGAGTLAAAVARTRRGVTYDDAMIAARYARNLIEGKGWTYNPMAADGIAYFVADDGSHGAELWRSDDTTAGTRLVADLEPGSGHSNPDHLTAAADVLYFTAHSSVGRELCSCTGGIARRLTDLGTALWPGVDGATLSAVGDGDAVVFAGADARGYELWRAGRRRHPLHKGHRRLLAFITSWRAASAESTAIRAAETTSSRSPASAAASARPAVRAAWPMAPHG